MCVCSADHGGAGEGDGGEGGSGCGWTERVQESHGGRDRRHRHLLQGDRIRRLNDTLSATNSAASQKNACLVHALVSRSYCAVNTITNYLQRTNHVKNPSKHATVLIGVRQDRAMFNLEGMKTRLNHWIVLLFDNILIVQLMKLNTTFSRIKLKVLRVVENHVI